MTVWYRDYTIYLRSQIATSNKNIGDVGLSENTNVNMPVIVDSTEERIENLIHYVRGQQVMIDSDLAMLYNVETKRLNESVKRNSKRFPESFCFQLTENEYADLRSQIATSNVETENTSSKGGRRYLPYAFTEQGIAMLSAVLRSEEAIRVSVNIMNAFVKMRRFLTENALMFDKLNSLELKQLEYQKESNEKFDQIFAYFGASIKDAGKKCFGISRIEDIGIISDILQRLEIETEEANN